jgi:filamentous hemagglutinin family protein
MRTDTSLCNCPRPLSSLIVLAAAGVLMLGAAGDVWPARPGRVLAPGTLPQGGVVRSGDASIRAPITTPGARGPQLQIDQRSQRAIIDWSSFNIAADSHVHFNQGGPTFEALNRIFDRDPSIIQGRLSATGRVYLYNQNGILFDRGSRVDVRALVASSLEIPDSVFLNGLGSAANETGPSLVGGVRPILLDENGLAVTDLEGRPWRNAVQNYGSLRSVEVDAQGEPTGNSPGGLIALFAPQVENRGVMVADNGQVMLAAGSTVFLQQYRGTVNSDDEFAMRGLVVRVQAGADPVDLTGLVANSRRLNADGSVRDEGVVRADRGNVSMVGLAINQAGRVSAGTAVNQNGSVWLLATNRLTTAAGSRTETPLADDGQTQVAEQRYEPNRGRVRLGGEVIDHAGSVLAPGGVVQIGGASAGGEAMVTPQRVFLGAGSEISVAGNLADLPFQKNSVTVRIGTNDLRDSPEQKGGFLFGKSVTFDLTRGNTPIFDIQSLIDSVPRGVGEKAASGGTISIAANEFVAQSGSLIDVSGGAWRFGAGSAVSSKVIEGGRVFDIHDAPANRRYDGLIEVVPSVQADDLRRWNAEGTRRLVAVADRGYQVFEVIPNAKWLSEAQLLPASLRGLFAQRPAYLEGRPAGSLELNASQIVLDGTLRATTAIGQFQRSAPPAAARVTLGAAPLVAGNNITYQLADVRVVAQPSGLPAGFGADTALPEARRDLVEIAAGVIAGAGDESDALRYLESAPGNLTVNAGGSVTVAADAALELAPGGALALRGDRFDIAGALTVASGAVSLLRGGNDSFQSAELVLRPGARISTAGLWQNDFLDGSASIGAPRLFGGGRADLRAATLDLQAGSTVDVSGGGRFTAARRTEFGNGGDITLLANAVRGDLAPDRNALRLDGRLLGLSGADSGTLRLRTNRIAIGPEAGGAGSVSSPQRLTLSPAFFSQGGFDGFDLEGDFGASVTGTQRIAPRVTSLVPQPERVAAQPTGSDLAGTLAATAQALGELPPERLRGVSLGLESRASQGDESTGVRIGEGVLIETTPGGRIDLRSGTVMEVAGTLRAPAGQISVDLSTGGDDAFGGRTLRIAPTARLEAPGAVVLQPTVDGTLRGTVRRAGTVSLTASRNDLAVEPGARIDVSGVSGALDLPQGPRLPPLRTTLTGDAGVVRISATEDAWLAGSFTGTAAPGAGGGAFGLDLRYHAANFDPTSLADARLLDSAHRIEIRPNGSAQPAFEAGVRRARVDALGLQRGGFDSIRLASQDVIEFSASTGLAAGRRITLDATQIRVADGAAASVSAPTVSFLNTPDRVLRPSTDGGGRSPVTATAGTGSLAVSAGAIDLGGHLVFSGLERLSLDSAGAIRAVSFPMEVSRLNLPLADREEAAREALTGSLATLADVTLRAREVSAASAVDFTLALAPTPDAATARPGSLLRIEGRGNPEPVLSADARLRFHADRIEQGGAVVAPLGRIEYRGDSAVALEDGSLTSVSAAGLTIPFGGSVNGLSLFYGLLDRTATPPEKAVELRGPDLTVAEGARIDISGGGDIQAVEFLPGAGGSRDVLVDASTFAILPGLSLDRAPVDSHIARRYAELGVSLGFAADGSLYDTIEIAPGGPVAAGVYPLLPGYYALLPGGYTVRRQSGSTDFLPGTAIARSDGATLVAGRLGAADTPVREARWSAYAVAPGSDAQRASEYRITGSAFLAERAAAEERVTPQLAADAGRLLLAAQGNFDFRGRLASTAAPGGRLGEVDIVAERLAVVGQRNVGQAPVGFAEIEAGTLSSFNASVVLGAARSRGPEGTRLAVAAEQVSLNNGASSLELPDLVVAARGRVEVGSGTQVRASGTAPGRDLPIEVLPDAGGVDGSALLRLSSGGDATVIRRGTLDTTRGDLVVAADARIAGNAIALDATGASSFAGALDLAPGGTLALGASRISLGEAPADTQGLVLDAAQVGALQGAGNLTLRSYSSIDLYAGSSVAAQGRLTLDTPGLTGRAAGADETLQAGELVLRNASGRAYAGEPSGSGSLRLQAGRIELGEGDKTIAGFDSVTLAADGELVASARRTAGADPLLTVAAPLELQAARIGAASGAAQRIEARDAADAAAPWRAVRISQPAGPVALAPAAGLGARLGIFGESIVNAGRIELPAGVVELGARGATAGAGSAAQFGSGILLADGSHIGAPGATRSFAGDAVAAPGGRVLLNAEAGDVVMAAQARIDVAGAGAGDAGRIEVRAPAGQVALGGVLAGQAGAGAAGGRLAVDGRTIAELSNLLTAASSGGFRAAIEARQRSGDVAVGDIALTTREFKLAADAGRIDFGASVDASGPGGGRIGLYAGNGLSLASTAQLTAAGTATDTSFEAPFGHGGEVTLSTREGVLAMDPAARIDVSAAASGKSDGGRVSFRAPRVANPDGSTGVAMDLRGSVALAGAAPGVDRNGDAIGRPGEVVIEGVSRYRLGAEAGVAVPADAASNPVYADYVALSDSAEAIRAATGLTGGAPERLRVQAGVELEHEGTLNLGSNWNLGDAAWRRNDVAGRLSLRAGGDLTINAGLGFGNDITIAGTGVGTVRADVLPAGRTWDIELVGGADLAAADPLATARSAGGGDVRLGSAAARVRSTDGAIRVAAGRDFVIADGGAALYTAGRAATADGNLNRYTRDGGDIEITAGRAVRGPATLPFVTEWLRRTTINQLAPSVAPAAGWWAHRAAFRGGVGSFGGGSVQVSAGGAVSDLLAVAPTSARPSGSGAAPSLAVRGGGDIRVDALGDMEGGEVLVGRGSAQLDSGGSFGATRAPDLFLLGESGTPAGFEAAVRVSALGDVAIRSASNPTIFILTPPSLTGTTAPDGFQRSQTAMFTFAPAAAASLVSVGGDVRFGNLADGRGGNAGRQEWSEFFAPVFDAIALTGSVTGPGVDISTEGMRLYPSRDQRMRLYAGEGVRAVPLLPGDGDPAQAPRWDAPAALASLNLNVGLNGAVQRIANAGNSPLVPRLTEANPAGPFRYRVVAAAGNVEESTLNLFDTALIQAGRDLFNLRLNLQNLEQDGLTVLRAGRDLTYGVNLANGVAVQPSSAFIRIGGPGRMVVQAGRNIDFGQAAGIDAGGNSFNTSLGSASSAAVTVMAGVPGALSLPAIDRLFEGLRRINTEPIENVAVAADGTSDIARSYAVPQALIDLFAGRSAGSDADFEADAIAVLAGEGIVAARGSRLAKTGAALLRANALAAGSPSQQRLRASTELIDEVFTGVDLAEGDIRMQFAQIRTQGGGGIDLLTPRGGIEVGLPVAVLDGFGNPREDLGVVTGLGGDVRAFLRNDMNINLSKVIAALGGDILAYAGLGDLDAGRGARESRSTQPPRFDVDPDTGERIFRPPTDVGGSGIRTVTFDPDGSGPLSAPREGGVVLIAPLGIVNAGEAGIASAGNIFIVAQQVLNANNISSGGQASGVPQVQTGSIAGLATGASSATAGTAAGADDAARSASDAGRDAARNAFRPSFITVEVLGFGDERDDARSTN